MADQPNILIIWGDDIGITNLSCYSSGIMGYRTPNIDRIAEEGVRFTDYYGEQSCTAGRAAFITGQNPYRTGLTKVGMPGADVGLRAEDPTIATALKAQGYATGQFGKNHFGDRDDFLPTAHGFDEFFGNLYHLNAEEEPELRDYPTEEDFPEFRKRFGPRGVLHSWANEDGTQRIENTGPLTKKRMETCDEEFRDAAVDFITRQHEADKPFFVWFNSTHMHFRTHGKPESKGRAGRWQSEYHDTMMDHDDIVGDLLDALDELGIADNTIVMYSTDNGPHMNSWPDAGMTPFRNEKNSNWEGAYRVPCVVRWPGHIPAGTVLNGIVSHNDWFVTLLAAVGVDDIADQLLAGADLNGTTFKVHLDGQNQLSYITGETDKSPRQYFFYVSDDGDLTAMRFDNWKFMFLEQRAPGTLQVWIEPYTELRVPKIFNLRTDPFERADITSNTYFDWFLDHIWLLIPAQAYVAQMMTSLLEFPPRQTPPSFSIQQVMEKLQAGIAKLMTPRSPTVTAVTLPAGEFTMGSDEHYPEEAPTHRVRVGAFRIEPHQVTNRRFAEFVEATRYVTVAERPLDPGDFPGAPVENLVPGSLVFTPTPGPVDLRHISQWWTWTPGARWNRPEGPASSIDDRLDHPVVHVSHEDAATYAAWVGASLPTEAQWEYAARGGLDGAPFTWGDEARPGGQVMANTWDGRDFPWRSTGESGFLGTSPVGSFPSNGYGLFDMAGNVWEWTDDWWTSAHPADADKPCCVPVDPRGGDIENSFDPAQPQFRVPRKVIKGGSHLCADTYCLRYRPAARRPQMIDTGTAHIGFRVVWNDADSTNT